MPARRLLLAAAVLLSATQALADARKSGYVTIDCPVIGASVLVDGRDVGVVPIERLELPFGYHELAVRRPGLIDFEKRITVRPGQHLVVEAVPARARSLLTVETSIPGGEVRLDGQLLGPLPITGHVIAPGRHTLVIRKQGLKAVLETFDVQPHRLHVSRPTLLNAEGSPAGGLLALDDLELELEPVSTPVESPGLELALELEPEVAPEPVKVAQTEAPAARDASVVQDFGSLPGLEPPAPPPPPFPTQPPLTAAVSEAPPSSAFVADPVAREQVEQARAPGTPVYKQSWFWAATGAVAVAAVAVPILTGYTGGYEEVRDPTAACSECLAVMNR